MVFSSLAARATRGLYEALTDINLSSQVVRFSLTFLDVWQVFALYRIYTDVVELGPLTAPVDYVIGVGIVLATMAVISIFVRSTVLAMLVLMCNIAEFMYLTFWALFYNDPPPFFTVGLFIFVTLVCIGGFWRVLLLHVRIHTRS